MRDCQVVDAWWSFDGPPLTSLLDGARMATVTDEWGVCTHAVGWMRDSEGYYQQGLRRAGVQSVLLCSVHDPRLTATHLADRYVQTLRQWGITQAQGDLSLPWPPGEKRDMRPASPLPLVVIHPGSGSPHKCTAGTWLGELIRKIAHTIRCSILICGGPADTPQLTQLQRACKGEGLYDIIQGQSVQTVARRIIQAALFLGHDSGLTHLAAVLGVPTIALFGPTDPTRWGPRGKRVTILRGPLCQCSNWEAVQQCFPKPCLNFSVDQVLAAMRQYLPG